jgi:hypothetical protein
VEYILIAALALVLALLFAISSPRSSGGVQAAGLHDTHDPNAVVTNDDFVAMVNFGQAQPRFAELPPPQLVGGDPNHIVLTDDEA